MGNDALDAGAARCPICLGDVCRHFTDAEKRMIMAFGWRSWADIRAEDAPGMVNTAAGSRRTASGRPV